VRRVLAILWIAGASVFSLADGASDAARADLARERKRLSVDVRGLADVSRRLEQALSQLGSASRVVADASSRGDPPDEITRREEAVSAAEQEVHSLLDRRRLLADRVVERRRTIAALESDVAAGRKPIDGLTGRWVVLLDPGEQRGSFRLNLDGTIVSGEYMLEGGYSGSLRGTFVNDRLRLERVDSRLGFSTIYYGRLARDTSVISGTWESTDISGGAPGSGRWKAVREEEKEETP
jgi:hypothetical protein